MINIFSIHLFLFVASMALILIVAPEKLFLRGIRKAEKQVFTEPRARAFPAGGTEMKINPVANVKAMDRAITNDPSYDRGSVEISSGPVLIALGRLFFASLCKRVSKMKFATFEIIIFPSIYRYYLNPNRFYRFSTRGGDAPPTVTRLAQNNLVASVGKKYPEVRDTKCNIFSIFSSHWEHCTARKKIQNTIWAKRKNIFSDAISRTWIETKAAIEGFIVPANRCAVVHREHVVNEAIVLKRQLRLMNSAISKIGADVSIISRQLFRDSVSLER